MAVYVNHTALSISDSSLSSSSEPTVVSTSKFRFTGSEVIKESDTVITVDENEVLSPGTSVKTTGEILEWIRRRLEGQLGSTGRGTLTLGDLKSAVHTDLPVSNMSVCRYLVQLMCDFVLCATFYDLNVTNQENKIHFKQASCT